MKTLLYEDYKNARLNGIILLIQNSFAVRKSVDKLNGIIVMECTNYTVL